MNGVIRSAALRATRLVRPYYSSDISLVAELSLRGEFAEVSDAVFYRRVTEDATVNADNYARAIQHWSPDATGPPKFHNWRFLADLSRSILKVRPGVRDCTLALAYTARIAYWSKKNLAVELRDAFRTY